MLGACGRSLGRFRAGLGASGSALIRLPAIRSPVMMCLSAVDELGGGAGHAGSFDAFVLVILHACARSRMPQSYGFSCM